jgi:hypothetical protein
MAPDLQMLPPEHGFRLHLQERDHFNAPVKLREKQTPGTEIGILSFGQFGGHH